MRMPRFNADASLCTSSKIYEKNEQMKRTNGMIIEPAQTSLGKWPPPACHMYLHCTEWVGICPRCFCVAWKIGWIC